MGSPHQVAQAIAERAVRAWAESFAGSDIGIPLGAVAALTLLQPPDQDPDQIREQLVAAEDEEIADLLSQVWCFFTILRPELAMRCGPFGRWLDEEPRDRSKVSGAAYVVRAAAQAGLFELTLSRNVEVDVLGHVHQELASKQSKQGQGQFYTPAEVADLMARLTMSAVRPGQAICEPAAGTGGMLRAYAQALRAEGRSPHEIWWYACDVDPVAVAALAVNLHVWDLGPRVVVGCANVLAEGDWEKRAREEQLAAIERNDRHIAMAHLIAEARSLFGDDGPEADEPRWAA
jgi:N-6 DNA Methylase